MKQIVFLLLLLPFCVDAQDKWQSSYTTKSGWEIHPGSLIKINAGKEYTYTYPKSIPDAMRMSEYQRFLHSNMAGNTFKVERLSRIRKGSTYTELAVLKIHDNRINRFNDVEYCIELENAEINSEISKPENKGATYRTSQ